MNRSECDSLGQAHLEGPGIKGARGYHMVVLEDATIQVLGITGMEMGALTHLGIHSIFERQAQHNLHLAGDPSGASPEVEEVEAFTGLENTAFLQEKGPKLLLNHIYVEVT